MREFVKVSSVLVIIVAIIAMSIAWVDDRPNGRTWAFRTAPVVVALAALALFLKLHFKRDEAPDLLYQKCGGYFDQSGFCFAISFSRLEGFCVLNTHFQNRYDRRCVAKVAVRPAKQLLSRADLDTMRFRIECEGAAFGLHQVAVRIPAELQGRRMKFEVGASVDYPEGRGRMVRFRDGTTLRADVDFNNTFTQSLTVLALLSGRLLFWRPAHLETTIPMNVSELVPVDFNPEAIILWRPGDAAI